MSKDELDAARYRFLRSKFTASTERYEQEQYVDSKGGFKRYLVVTTYTHAFEMEDSWQLVETTNSDKPTDFDVLIDNWMAEK